MTKLNPEQQRRYARHIVLSEIGTAGQGKLLSSSALVIGAGGLGSAALAYLAAAGVGRIGVIDADRVELSNLQRQVLFETADIGRPKVEAARDRLEEINPDCKVEAFFERLTKDNANVLIKNFDIVLDGSDNFETRFAVSDACFQEEKPLVAAAISGFAAQISTFKPYLGAAHPCYRCLVSTLPERERTCAQEGVIGPLAGMLGAMQALEAVKELLAVGASLSGALFRIDALTMQVKRAALAPDAKCPACNSHLERKTARS